MLSNSSSPALATEYHLTESQRIHKIPWAHIKSFALSWLHELLQIQRYWSVLSWLGCVQDMVTQLPAARRLRSLVLSTSNIFDLIACLVRLWASPLVSRVSFSMCQTCNPAFYWLIVDLSSCFLFPSWFCFVFSYSCCWRYISLLPLSWQPFLSVWSSLLGRSMFFFNFVRTLAGSSLRLLLRCQIPQHVSAVYHWYSLMSCSQADSSIGSKEAPLKQPRAPCIAKHQRAKIMFCKNAPKLRCATGKQVRFWIAANPRFAYIGPTRPKKAPHILNMPQSGPVAQHGLNIRPRLVPKKTPQPQQVMIQVFPLPNRHSIGFV